MIVEFHGSALDGLDFVPEFSCLFVILRLDGSLQSRPKTLELEVAFWGTAEVLGDLADMLLGTMDVYQ